MSSPLPPRSQTSILVLSPTRELAKQIEVEAERVLKGSAYGVKSVVGGTNINRDKRDLAEER